MKKKPTVLMILDGFGLNKNPEANAVYAAKTPNIDRLMKEYPFVEGNASGLAVGLPDGQMGNSEVGHMNMGAGRIVYQELTRISKAISDGDFFENPVLKSAMEQIRQSGKHLHIYGLLSDGGVHSHNTHLYGLLEMAKRMGLTDVSVHCFMDGRDTAPTSGITYIRELENKMETIGVGRIATVIGRFYAMDRDNRWERIQEAYLALTNGTGRIVSDVETAVLESYQENITDEFIKPIVVKDVPRIQDGDAVICFNFRPDRAREITRAFCDDNFSGFERGNRKQVSYVCFTEYDGTILNNQIAFQKEELTNTFGAYLAANGKTQARIAETEKYAHVTFFFNGGVEEPNEGEDRILVPSPKVATYDLKPEMSAYEVCDRLLEAIHGGKYDVIIINFANPDMVGHTGVLSAAIKAIEAVDCCVGKAVEAVLSAGGQMFLCADHGNAEQEIDYKTGESFTAHTTNPVPFILISDHKNYRLKENGRLCDIVPTLIDMMGMEQPKEMTGVSLLIK